RYFETSSGRPTVNIDVLDEYPTFGSLPDIPATTYTLDYVVYRSKSEIYTDYHGKGLRVWNPQNGRYQIYSGNSDLRHEIAYLTILSSVGQHLDSRHIHRVHALGVSQNGKAILILLPEKGGKTTLALRLIKSGKFKLLSEDSPLISSRGEILPFPLRMGILPGGEQDIPAKYLYKADFLRIGTKIMVDIDYFADKIGTVSQPWMVLLGERVLGNESRIIPASKLRASKEFIKNSVVGLGLHQGLEYLLGGNIWGTIGKSALAWSRLNNSLKVLSRSQVYRYQIGHDFEKNNQVLIDFLH
ncbi:MAG TPA: hypothetical protein VF318_08275, partial [Dehalococcoidales bacterium]